MLEPAASRDLLECRALSVCLSARKLRQPLTLGHLMLLLEVGILRWHLNAKEVVLIVVLYGPFCGLFGLLMWEAVDVTCACCDSWCESRDLFMGLDLVALEVVLAALVSLVSSSSEDLTVDTDVGAIVEGSG